MDFTFLQSSIREKKGESQRKWEIEKTHQTSAQTISTMMFISFIANNSAIQQMQITAQKKQVGKKYLHFFYI